MPSIRLAVDAVVEYQGAVLLVEFDDAQFGRHFGLPGGGVEAGEAIHTDKDDIFNTAL
jgi:ADP-ribose pyrophosphatase YjhB (NUDIX family)